MTRAATVVRHNDQLEEAIDTVVEAGRARRQAAPSPTPAQWTNQNVVYTKALRDMFPIAKAILKGALARDECRGAHYKPDFDMPGIDAERPRRTPPPGRSVVRQLRRKEPQVAQDHHRHASTPPANRTLTYEDVDTILIPPAPAALRPGRRRSDRRSLEIAAESTRQAGPCLDRQRRRITES